MFLKLNSIKFVSKNIPSHILNFLFRLKFSCRIIHQKKCNIILWALNSFMSLVILYKKIAPEQKKNFKTVCAMPPQRNVESTLMLPRLLVILETVMLKGICSCLIFRHIYFIISPSCKSNSLSQTFK